MKQPSLFLVCVLLTALAALCGCSTTRHVPDGEHLLRKNNVDIRSNQGITRKGELNDNLRRVIVQKTNTFEFGILPFKLWAYNARYKKLIKDSTLPNTVEAPVLYDTLLTLRSALNMKSLLFNRGYFYARISDTVKYRKKKAFVSYRVQTGTNYLIRNLELDVDDAPIRDVIRSELENTKLVEGEEFSYSLLDAERSRITEQLRNIGYYRFTQDNISFQLDTLNKGLQRNNETAFETAINFIARPKSDKRPTLNIKIIVRRENDEKAYFRYLIGNTAVYPDFVDRNDIADSTLMKRQIKDVVFRYHNHYIQESIIYKNIFLVQGALFSQNNYDLTISKLNELGIFQYVRVLLVEDTTVRTAPTLRIVILLNPTKKYDVSANFEVSTGYGYDLGNYVGIGFHDRNVLHGANRLSLLATGGVQISNNSLAGQGLANSFYVLSKTIGFSGNLTFPRFIFPQRKGSVNKLNLPRTIIGAGFNLIDRREFFTLTNTTFNYTYNWRYSPTRTYDFTPVFVSIYRLPRITDTFQLRLDSNTFLRNSYRPVFIEGENVTYVFNNQGAPDVPRSYSYVRMSAEEAGLLLSGVTAYRKKDIIEDQAYSQYLKFEVDARHYFQIKSSVLALRFLTGVGIPYGISAGSSLPYVKQYFSGGAYSVRGWRVRSLGPGGSPPPSDTGFNFVDRSGDIRLELNAEYRFPIVQLFSNSIKFNGALFTDAGNIWLANPDPQYPNGEFNFKRFPREIAISSGAGARFDIGGFLTLRLDASFPIRKPYVTENNGWVIREIDFKSTTWRDRNLLLNIAIGYPF